MIISLEFVTPKCWFTCSAVRSIILNILASGFLPVGKVSDGLGP